MIKPVELVNKPSPSSKADAGSPLKADREKGFSGTGWLRRALSQREASVFLMLLLVSGYLSFSSSYFLEPRNLLNVGRQFSVVGIVAIGEALVIISGAIDLSVGSVIGLAAVSSALVAQWTKSPALGLLAGLLSGAVVGLINGFLYTRIKINPFIVTLGMLSVARGCALLLTGGLPYPFENWVGFLGAGRIVTIPVLVLARGRQVLLISNEGVSDRMLLEAAFQETGAAEKLHSFRQAK